MNLQSTIIDSPWMLANRTAHAYLPAVAQLLKGEAVSFGETKTPKPYAFLPTSQRKIRYRNFSQAPEGSVAVYSLKGVVLKEDGWCSEGTETLMRKMGQADEMKNISAHLIEIDSGGGQGSNIQTVAQFIRRELKKPVIAWFNGIAASAAYYIAAAADEIYASENTDMVGSIGVMFSFFDFRGFYEEQGIKLHEIYASQSSLKNDDFKQARDGEYEKIRTRLLDPMADQFIIDVKTYRPDISGDDAFKGEIFTADDAVEINMIDGIMSFDAAVDRAIQLSNHQKEDEMNNIEAVLGYQLESNSDGGVFLQKEELQKLNSKLASEGEEVVSTASLENLEATLDEQGEKIEALEAKLSDLTAEVVTKTEFESFKAEAAVPPTTAFSQEDPQAKEEDAEDELDRITRAAAEAGGTLRVTE